MANPLKQSEEFNQLQSVTDRLVKDANAKVTFIVDKKGKLCAASGDVDNLDTTSLASLTAGNADAAGGMAKLLKENEFATQFHEGEKPNVHIQRWESRCPGRAVRQQIEPGPGPTPCSQSKRGADSYSRGSC